MKNYTMFHVGIHRREHRDIRVLWLCIVVTSMAILACDMPSGEDILGEPKENSPPIIEAQTLTVAESALLNMGTVRAQDPDEDPLSFSITSNSPKEGIGLFEFADPSSGVLSVVAGQSLNYDTAPVHNITVQVSDGKLSALAIITIMINKIAEENISTNKNTVENSAPMLGSENISIPEDTPSGTTVKILRAQDPDNDPLTYTIISPALEMTPFSITPSGTLQLKQGESLNYDTAPVHNITVQVSDGTNATTARVTITVTHVQTTPPQQLITAQEGSTIIIGENRVTVGRNEKNYSWKLINSPEGIEGVEILSPSHKLTKVNLPFLNERNMSIDLEFQLTTSDLNDPTQSSTTIQIVTVSSNDLFDSDGDALIEIRNLNMLHNIRYSLNGSEYKTSESAEGITLGCPAGKCIGYELVRNLDFDSDGDGITWSASDGSYLIDNGDIQEPYFTLKSNGSVAWQPIGGSDSTAKPFEAIFEGNGYSIYNLVADGFGFFHSIRSGQIRNVHIVNALVLGGTSAGVLAGSSSGSSIVASSSSGIVENVLGEAGGLVGISENKSDITASYSIAKVISAYGNYIGGLIGYQTTDTRAVYSSGSASGFAVIGSLSGSLSNNARAIASYSSGSATGSENVGNFIGTLSSSYIEYSYGFGNAMDSDSPDNDDFDSAPNSLGNSLPEGVTQIDQLSAANAGALWNNAQNYTEGAWDFNKRTIDGGPSLKYADYDGNGSKFHCADAASPPAQAILIANCGEHLPHQF